MITGLPIHFLVATLTAAVIAEYCTGRVWRRGLVIWRATGAITIGGTGVVYVAWRLTGFRVEWFLVPITLNAGVAAFIVTDWVMSSYQKRS